MNYATGMRSFSLALLLTAAAATPAAAALPFLANVPDTAGLAAVSRKVPLFVEVWAPW